MNLLIYCALVILPAALIILFYCFAVKHGRDILPKEHKLLDNVCALTNFIMVLLYVPISITGLFAGMMGESFITSGTALQRVLCELVGILGVSTPVAAYGGLIVSVILRRQGHSLRSFLFQFSGVLYLAFVFGISAIPFCL